MRTQFEKLCPIFPSLGAREASNSEMSIAIGKTNKQIKVGSPQPKDQEEKGRVARQKCLIESKYCVFQANTTKESVAPISTPAAKGERGVRTSMPTRLLYGTHTTARVTTRKSE